MIGQDRPLAEETLARFRGFLADRSTLAPDLLTPAAHVVAAWGGEDGWNTIRERYRAGSTPQDKVRYLIALAATPDPNLLARTLDMALSDEVRTQDGPFLVAEVMSNPVGGALAWAWVEEHWERLRERFPAALMARLLEGVTALVDPAVAESMHTFAASHDLPMAGPRLNQVLERMDINVALSTRLQGTIGNALHG